MIDETNTEEVGAPPAAPVETEVAEATEQQEPATPANAETEQERDDKGRFKRNDAQARINELTGRWRQTERELEWERQQRIQLEQQVRQPQAASSSAPKLEDFNDFNEWGAAMVQHARQEAERHAQQHIREQQQSYTQAQIAQQFGERERQYAQAHPDYAEAIQSFVAARLPFAPEVAEVVAASEHGPAIVHHLATHLDVADRLSRLPAHLAAAELARIEARVSAPKTRPISQAPSPPPTVAGGSKSAAPNLENLSYAEYKALRMKG